MIVVVDEYSGDNNTNGVVDEYSGDNNTNGFSVYF